MVGSSFLLRSFNTDPGAEGGFCGGGSRRSNPRQYDEIGLPIQRVRGDERCSGEFRGGVDQPGRE
jgi:hypothetical protein